MADEIHAGEIFRGKLVWAVYPSSIPGNVMIEFEKGAISLPGDAEVWVLTQAAETDGVK